MAKSATENFEASKQDLRKLARDDNADVALAAKMMLKHRYGEEVSL